MKYLVLSSAFLVTFAFAETPTKQNDALWECSYETKEPHMIRGSYYTVYSNWVFQVYATKRPGIFLVKEGLRDLNQGAEFVFDKEHLVKERKSGSQLTYQSVKDLRIIFTIVDQKKGYSTSEYKGADYDCEKDPWYEYPRLDF